ncbi:hypothetical protein J2T20_001891 [Paenibacillus wynnii]|nr:hypothetical protein [Paenibacillus wynnii]
MNIEAGRSEIAGEFLAGIDNLLKRDIDVIAALIYS